MGMYYNNNPIASAASYLKNIFKATGQKKPFQPGVAVPGVTTSPVNPAWKPATAGGSPYSYKPYQIKTGDTFEKIAEQNGASVADVQAANSGMAVPPPNGSYINLPNGQVAGGPAVMNNPSVAYQTTGGTPGTFQSMNGMMNLQELSANIQQQVANGQMPSVVSAYTPILNPTTGQPVTAMEMQQNGYTYDPKAMEWKLASSAQTTATSGGGNSNPKTVYYSKARGYVTPEVARLLRKKKRRRQQDNKVPVEQPLSNGSISTTLNVHLGGG